MSLKLHPPCLICAGPVLRRKGEPHFKWVRRRGCSARCSKKLQGRRTVTSLPPKNCAICEVEFSVRDDESARAFMARKTCGAECRNKLQAQNSGHKNIPVNNPVWWREKWPVDYAGGFARANRERGDRLGPTAYKPATLVLKEAST